MTKIELHTEVEEAFCAEDVPGFVVKKVDLGGLRVHTPIRTIYLGVDIPSEIRSKILDMEDERDTLLEVNRTIYRSKSYESLKEAISSEDDDKIRKLLKINEEVARRNVILTFSFSMFPNQGSLKNVFEDFLQHLHGASRIVLVPHVRFSREGAKTAINYSSSKFVQYVDHAMEILNEWNTKPLFAPLDIDYDKDTRDQILKEYAKRGYTNIWIDFKGQGMTSTKIGKIRGILRGIERTFGENSKEIVVYLANIRKVPRGILDEVRLPPSDILGAFVYGDIIGSPWKGIVGYVQESDDEEPYWERRGFSSEEEYKKALFNRDCSIFDNGSYYYWHPNEIQIFDKILEEIKDKMINLGIKKRYQAEKISNSINGILSLRELKTIREIVNSEGAILGYLDEKDFFKSDGRHFLEKISKKTKGKENKESKNKSLFDFMNERLRKSN